MTRLVTTLDDLFDQDFPEIGTRAEQLGFLLNYAIFAPSIYNSQPWQFDLSNDQVTIYSDRTRPLPVRDPYGRQLIISCGAAIFYLKVAARHFGYRVTTHTLPDPEQPDLLAKVELLAYEPPTPHEEQLFEAIRTRRTNRNKFEDRAIPPSVIAELKAAAEEEGCPLIALEGEEARRDIKELVVEADYLQWADKRFRNELSSWLRSNMNMDYDGIQVGSLGLGDFVPYTLPQLVRSLDLGSDRAAWDGDLIDHSAALAVMSTENDTTHDWLATGMSLAHVLLQASASKLSASFINQPVEVPHLRPRLRDLCQCAQYPQIAIRLGYGPDVPLTPRRSAESVQV